MHILNCLIGLQSYARFADVEENYHLSLEIAEFSNNQIDFFMSNCWTTWDLLSVPVGTKIYLDFYDESRLQVKFNGVPLYVIDPQLQNKTSIYSPKLNATVVYLNYLGQYHILYNVRFGSTEWAAPVNGSILVVEVMTDKFTIGAFFGLWFSSSLGISVVCVIIYLKKRRSIPKNACFFPLSFFIDKFISTGYLEMNFLDHGVKFYILLQEFQFVNGWEDRVRQDLLVFPNDRFSRVVLLDPTKYALLANHVRGAQ